MDDLSLTLTHSDITHLLWWMIFEAVHEFLGGRHVITVVAVLYITDITSIENRWLHKCGNYANLN